MIVKNEEETLPRCFRSLEETDAINEFVIVDTGSEDGTVEIAKKFGKVHLFTQETHPENFFLDDASTGLPEPHSGKWALADFSAARNYSFNLATSDFILWVDADDVFMDAKNLKRCLEIMEEQRVDVGSCYYDYAKDDAGRVTCRLIRERLVRRTSNAKWVNAIHEIIVPGPNSTTGVDLSKLINIVHERPRERKIPPIPHRNYKLLLREIEKAKGKPDPRTLFYLGNEARFIDIPKAMAAYAQYIELSGWQDERASARVALGELYEIQGNYESAFREYSGATVDLSDYPEGWFGLGRILYYQQKWADCIRVIEKGFACGNTHTMTIHSPLDRAFSPHIFYNVALSRVGRVRDALESCRKALAINPNNGHLQANNNLFSEIVDREDVEAAYNRILSSPYVTPILKTTISEAIAPDGKQKRRDAVIKELWQENIRRAPTKALDFIDVLSETDPVLMNELRRRSIRLLGAHKYYPVRTVTIWTGPAVEPWGAASLGKGGIGGSETACIEVATRLAANGYDVTVYGDFDRVDDAIEGVTYRHYDTYEATPCDVFISSRQPWITDRIPPCVLRLLWVHDVHVGEPSAALHSQLLKFDRILCLTNWHKEFFLSTYPFIHPDTIIVTRNGIDETRFSEWNPWEKRQNRLVYSSSPNRGLDVLLDFFPEIRKEVPDAELHIYYGFDSWRASVNGDVAQLTWIDNLTKRIATTEGVIYHGRVDQKTLAAEMLISKVLSFPTWFTETSCITAMEAQAAGCIPVTTRLAALAETAANGFLIDPPNTSESYRKAFTSTVIQTLRDESAWRVMAELNREYALKNFTWNGLVRDWMRMFEQLISETQTSVVPKFKSI